MFFHSPADETDHSWTKSGAESDRLKRRQVGLLQRAAQEEGIGGGLQGLPEEVVPQADLQDLVDVRPALQADEELGLVRQPRGLLFQLVQIQEGGVGIEGRADLVEALALCLVRLPGAGGRPDVGQLGLELLHVVEPVRGQVFELAPGVLAGKGQEVPVLLPVPQRAAADDEKRVGAPHAVAVLADHAADERILACALRPEAPRAELGRGAGLRGQRRVAAFHPAGKPLGKGPGLTRGG